MSVTYDWSPVFQALQGFGQRYQYQKALQSMFGPQQPQQQPAGPLSGDAMGARPLPTPPMTINPGSIGGVPLPPQNIPSQPSPIQNAPIGGAPAPSPIPNAPMGGRMAQLMPLLKMLPPEQGMPLLLQMAMRPPEYDTTPHEGINPATGKRGQYVLDKLTGTPHWLDVTPESKMEFVNGQAVDPYNTSAGTTIPLQDRVKVAGGMVSNDGGKTWTKIPGYTEQQRAIAQAKEGAKPPKPPNPNAPIQLVHPSAGY